MTNHDIKVVKKVLSAQRRYLAKGKRFYTRQLEKDYGERIKPLLGDNITINDLINFYVAPDDKIDRKLEVILNNFFKLSNHTEAKELIREIDTAQLNYAMNAISLEDKRLIIQAMEVGLSKRKLEK